MLKLQFAPCDGKKVTRGDGRPPRAANFAAILMTLAIAIPGSLAEVRAAETTNNNAKNAEVERRLSHSTRILASDEFEGRGPGTKGIDRAAELIAEEFKQAGLETEIFDGSPYQRFSITSSTKLGKKNHLTLVGPAKRRSEKRAEEESEKEEKPEGKPAAETKENADVKSEEAADPDSEEETEDQEEAKKKEEGSEVEESADEKIPARRIELKLGEDFNPLAIGGSGEFSLPLVFAGYGITAPEEEYDDYADLDVKDKAVIILRHEPQQNNPHGKFDGASHSDHAPFRRKVSNAYQHGAAAILFVTSEPEIERRVKNQRKRWQAALKRLTELDEKFREIKNTSVEQLEKHRSEVKELTTRIDSLGQRMQAEYDPVMGFQRAGRDNQGRSIPVVHCRRETIDRALKAAGQPNLSTLEKQIDEGPTPQSFALEGWEAIGEISVEREGLPVKNVVAVLEGEGPTADETIVIGAHYDHLGRGGRGSFAKEGEIHNGADDNASGTSTLLEVARRLAAREEKLPRRIVFVAFTGEERGLLGSAEYVRDPPFPLDKTVAMLNLDMVGRMKDDKLIVGGVGTAKQFDAWLEGLNEQAQLKLTKNQSGFGPSDHATFAAKKIPVLFFFTGLHTDYHRPSDDFELVNIGGMRKIANLVAGMAEKIATEAEPPKHIEVARGKLTMRLGEDPDSTEPKNPRPYFGCIPDYSQEIEGLPISGVAPGGPAAEAGLKGGDVIVRLGKSKIGGIEDFDNALRNHEAGETVEVVVTREGKEVTLKVKLAAPK